MLELLDLLANGSLRIHLIDNLEAQCRALIKFQEPSGLWRTLLDQPLEEGSYIESSAAAGFAYGTSKALRLRCLKGEEFRESAMRAVKDVLGKVSKDGELLDTSFRTAMEHTLQHYKDIA